MKRNVLSKVGVSFLGLIIFLSFCILPNVCDAFDLFGDSLVLKGWAENFTAYRVRATDSGGRFANFRNTLQIEGDLKISNTLNLHGIIKNFYEGAWDIDSDLDQRPEDIDGMKSGEGDDILRELYVDYNCENLFLRLGKQQVVWGESDGLRLADIINPLDLRYHYIFESWEDIRVPTWMARMIYSIPSTNNYTVELVYIPVNFEPTRIAPEGANWAFPGYSQYIIDAMKHSEPDRSLKKGEIGVRLGAIIKGWDLKVFDFWTRSDLPVFKEDAYARMFGSGFTDLDLFDYERENVAGFSFNYYEERTKAVFRGEFTYTFDHVFNRSLLNLEHVEKDIIDYMIGFDRPTYIKFLNENSFFISFQFFGRYIMDHEDGLVTTYTGDKSHMEILTFLINTSYYKDKIKPQIFATYNFRKVSWIQPQITYIPNDYWEITLGANLILADEYPAPYGYFGPFQHNDEMFLRVRFNFI